MSQATHNDNIDFTINIAPAPRSGEQAIGPLAVMAVDAFDTKDGPQDDGTRRKVRRYANASEITDAVDAADGIRKDWFDDMASSLDNLPNAAFPLKIINVDFSDFGGAAGDGHDYDQSAPEELYLNALEAAIDSDGEFYGIAPDITKLDENYVNTDTGSGATEDPTGAAFIYKMVKSTKLGRREVFLQDKTTAWKTESDPATSTAISNDGSRGIQSEGGEDAGRIFHDYHDVSFDGDTTTNFPKDADDDRAYANIAYGSQLLAFDLDEQAPPADLDITGTKELDANLQGSEVDAIKDNNSNVGLPYPPSKNYVDPGQSLNGRPMYEYQSVDWLYFRLQSDIRSKKVELSRGGEKFPVSNEGEKRFSSLIERRLAQGEAADHFEPGSTEVLSTGSDSENEEISAVVAGEFLTSARVFTIEINLTRS